MALWRVLPPEKDYEDLHNTVIVVQANLWYDARMTAQRFFKTSYAGTDVRPLLPTENPQYILVDTNGGLSPEPYTP